MTRFDPAQIDRLLDSAPAKPAVNELTDDFFVRNEEAILRRCRKEQQRHRRPLWMAAAAAVMLLVVATLVVRFVPQHPAVAPLEGMPAAADDDVIQTIATFDDDELDEWEEIEDCDIFLECM